MGSTVVADFMLSAAIVLAVASPMTGSFLKCWADRARTGVSVADGRSFCDNCGKTLAARDLVPILSWLLAGGKSRCCKQPISATLLLAEIASLCMALSALILLPRQLWLPALLLAWGLQALSLLTGANDRAGWTLALGTTLLALSIPLLAADAPLPIATALSGSTAGAIIWGVVAKLSPPHAAAALVLLPAGAMVGPVWGALALGIGLVVAVLHGRLRDTQTIFETTSLAIGFATGTWLVWLGLFL